MVVHSNSSQSVLIIGFKIHCLSFFMNLISQVRNKTLYSKLFPSMTVAVATVVVLSTVS